MGPEGIDAPQDDLGELAVVVVLAEEVQQTTQKLSIKLCTNRTEQLVSGGNSIYQISRSEVNTHYNTHYNIIIYLPRFFFRKWWIIRMKSSR